MAEQNLWRRFIAAVNREYERRVKAASLVSEYGAANHSHDDHADDEGEVAVIANVPRGTRVSHESPPQTRVDTY